MEDIVIWDFRDGATKRAYELEIETGIEIELVIVEIVEIAEIAKIVYLAFAVWPLGYREPCQCCCGLTKQTRCSNSFSIL